MFRLSSRAAILECDTTRALSLGLPRSALTQTEERIIAIRQELLAIAVALMKTRLGKASIQAQAKDRVRALQDEEAKIQEQLRRRHDEPRLW